MVSDVIDYRNSLNNPVQVRDLIFAASPYFFIGIALEYIYVLLTEGTSAKRFHYADSVTSTTAGSISRIIRTFIKGSEVVVYAWVYSKV